MRNAFLLPTLAAFALSAACSGETAPSPATTGQSPPNASPERPRPPDTGPKDEEAPATPAECTGAPGELYAINLKRLASTDELKLCTLKGHVLLIVNGASGCGQTYQYEPLQELYLKYKDRKFEVLAFPSKSFNQEKDTDQEVSAFCTDKYKITFPLFTIAPVIDKPASDPGPGETAQPIYQWLRAQPGMEAPVPWNFEKFLIGRDGKPARRFVYTTNPTPSFATPKAEGGDTLANGGTIVHEGIVNIVEDAILTELERP